MVYFAQDKRNEDAIELIQDVLVAHVKLKEDREAELANLFLSSGDNPFFEVDHSALEKTIETLSAQISAIQYTLEYVKLILKARTLDGE